MSSCPRERPDMLHADSPEGIRVLQLTDEPGLPCAHVYMEAQVFSPDSRLFIFERSGNAHEPDLNDPEHKYMLCDIADGCKISPVIEELNAVGPSFAPDGSFIYYFVDNSAFPEGNVLLKRVRPDGSSRETICTVGEKTSHDFMLRLIYSHSSISSDSKRLVTGACVIDRKSSEEAWGVTVFDLEKASPEVIWTSSYLGNGHVQYCRSLLDDESHDILVQQNHGYIWDMRTREELARGLDSLGVDIHVIRDNGEDLRTMPWGRDAEEKCQGHQCWRGETGWAITSTETVISGNRDARLIESLPVAEEAHLGKNITGGIRNELSGEFSDPQFHHFGTDKSGTKLITDYWFGKESEHIYLLELGEPGKDPAASVQFILDTRTSFSAKRGVQNKKTQSHPFLSLDGKRGFFNSNESGTLQIYMIEGI